MNLENIAHKRKRLIYRSWHRGTKEMDLIMGSFADKNVPKFSEAELDEYEIFLENNDPDLYNWIIGKIQPEGDLNRKMLQVLKNYIKFDK